MPDLLSRIAAARKPAAQRSSIDAWLSNYLIPSLNQFTYGGNVYPFGLQQTLTGQKVQEYSATLPGFAAALRACPPAFAAQVVRALVLSQARFTFRNRRPPRRTFGTTALSVLEQPWPNATTGELLARMEWHAGLAGNAYVHREAGRLRLLRPDWVGVLYGSNLEPDDPAHALDGQLLGFVYWNGGLTSGNTPRTLLASEVAWWSPIPDPENVGIGMSWITPALRDIQGDKAATDHKLRFFEQGATPNLVIKGIPATTAEQFNEIVAMLESRHAGLANAYRTLYLTAGADASVVGSNLQEADLAGIQGKNETRISVLSRVPAVILGISEGLAGSTLNAGNFGMSRRLFADGWIYPTLQDVAAALSTIIDVPSDAELWFDTSDMPILREDAKDAAEIVEIQARTISGLVKEGFTPETSIPAVLGQDLAGLKHTGLVSVQLQPPGTTAPEPQPNGQSNGQVPAQSQ